MKSFFLPISIAFLLGPAALIDAANVASANNYCMQCSQRRNHKDMYPDPEGDCHSFYQCFYLNETYATGIKMSCAPGTYWHDEILQCMPEGPTPCFDLCQNVLVANKGCYAMPGNCLTFARCSTTTSYGFCCPQGTSFNADTCQCDTDPACNDPCLLPPRPVTTEQPPVVFDTYCIDSYGNHLEPTSQPSVFLAVADPDDPTQSHRVSCAAGTNFNLTTCRCEGEVEPQLPTQPQSRQCSIYLPFDEDTNDHSIHKFYTDLEGEGHIVNDISARGSGSLLLNGGHLEIPATKNMDFVDQVSVCFYFRCLDGEPCTGGLFSNNKDPDESEFSLIIAIVPGQFIIAQGALSYASGYAVFRVNATLNTARNYTQICSVLDGEYAKLYADNVFIGQAPVSGQVKIAHCPVSIGSDQTFGDFRGYIDEVLVCPFGLTNDEIDAHWAGQPAMENAGLIPAGQAQVPPYTDTTAMASPSNGCGHNKYWNSGENYKTNLQIVGGVPTRDHEFPWYTLLYTTEDGGIWKRGSVITDKWLITAAHLFPDNTDPSTWYAFFGRDSGRPSAEASLDELKSYYSVWRQVTRIIIHPNYNATTLDYDYALVEFGPSVSLDTWQIRPICLPSSCDSACQPNERVVIAGYGATSENSRDWNPVMKKATMAIVDQELCTRAYMPFDYYQVWVTDSAICGSNNFAAGGIGTCNGDGGTPWHCYKNGYFTVDAVDVTGTGCAEPRFPSVGGRVCIALDWIHQYID